jgi:branched-chain amino acid transport system ATP-binding protein
VSELLQVVDLNVSYGRSPAVAGMSLTVSAGEVVGLIGPNGAGKSTTLTAIFGSVRVRSGQVRFDGQSVRGWRPEDIARAGLALVPEGRHTFDSLTVRENLLLGAAPRRRSRSIDKDISAEVERFPVLGRYFDEQAGTLSGGEQQQLAIARALVSKPKLLMLDEPSLGLAPLVVDAVFAALSDLRASGMTILLVEQNATRAIAFADRTYVMRGGRVVAAGTADELANGGNLSELYLGAKRAHQ